MRTGLRFQELRAMSEPEITSILKEKRIFSPSPEFSNRARVKSMDEYRRFCAEAERDPLPR